MVSLAPPAYRFYEGLFLSPVLLLPMQNARPQASRFLYFEGMEGKDFIYQSWCYLCLFSVMSPCPGCPCQCHLQWSIVWLMFYSVAHLVAPAHLWPPSNIFWACVLPLETAFSLSSPLCRSLAYNKKHVHILKRGQSAWAPDKGLLL